MAKPVILAVDDDPSVLAAVERDLRRQYRANYRILKAGSGAEGLDAARELAVRNTPIALFLVDQRMPGMSGIELLRGAAKLHPASRRLLLTAYAHSEVAIAGISKIGLDYYLVKPWDPPEDRLYPVLDDLLAERQARSTPLFEGVRILGSQWSPQSFAAKEFLSRNRVPYEWVDLHSDATARLLAESVAGDLSRLPVVLFPDGSHLIAPSQVELATKAGMQTQANRPFYDVVVVGGGPAGLANAVYAASEGLRTLIVESNAAGGQAGTSSMIENYLGFPAGVTGADLAQRASTPAKRFGAELLTGQEVVALRRDDPYRVVVLADGTELTTYTVIITTGMSARMLAAPGAEKLQGVRVYYRCRDDRGRALPRSRRVRGGWWVVGGANSAGQGALFFSRYARKVTIIYRAASLEQAMSQYLVDRIHTTPNIEVVSGVEVEQAHGTEALEQITVRVVKSGELRTLPTWAMFIFSGVKPHTKAFVSLLECDSSGFVLTSTDLPIEHGRARGWPLARAPYAFETSMPGVFAAGDVRAGANRRVAAAVGEGSAAVYSVHRYLKSV